MMGGVLPAFEAEMAEILVCAVIFSIRLDTRLKMENKYHAPKRRYLLYISRFLASLDDDAAGHQRCPSPSYLITRGVFRQPRERVQIYYFSGFASGPSQFHLCRCGHTAARCGRKPSRAHRARNGRKPPDRCGINSDGHRTVSSASNATDAAAPPAEVSELAVSFLLTVVEMRKRANAARRSGNTMAVAQRHAKQAVAWPHVVVDRHAGRACQTALDRKTESAAAQRLILVGSDDWPSVRNALANLAASRRYGWSSKPASWHRRPSDRAGVGSE
jgi:hypothetical protein